MSLFIWLTFAGGKVNLCIKVVKESRVGVGVRVGGRECWKNDRGHLFLIFCDFMT